VGTRPKIQLKKPLHQGLLNLYYFPWQKVTYWL
jgi:hypothetical protein